MSPWSDILKGRIKSPSIEYDPTDNYSSEQMLQQELAKRYNMETVNPWTKNPKGKNYSPNEFVNMMRKDMGISPYKLNFNPKSDIQDVKGMVTFGDYDPDARHLRLNKSYKDLFGEATLAHELGHLADQIASPWFEATNYYRIPLSPEDLAAAGRTHNDHFVDYTGTNPDLAMAQSLNAQRDIEQGFYPDPQVLGNMPWLKDVAPFSSNKLANPWSKKISGDPVSYTPDTWNRGFSPLWHRSRLLPDQAARGQK